MPAQSCGLDSASAQTLCRRRTSVWLGMQPIDQQASLMCLPIKIRRDLEFELGFGCVLPKDLLKGRILLLAMFEGSWQTDARACKFLP